MSYIANVVAKEVFTLFSEHFKRRTPSHTYGVCASPYCVLNVFNMRCITGWTPFRSPRWQSTRTKHRDEKVLCLVIARTYSKAATLITSVDVHHRQYEWECSATRRGHGVVVGRTHDALRAIKNDQFAHAGLRHSHHPGALRRPLRWCLWIKFIARVAHASHTEAPAITGRIWSPRRILPGLGHTAHSRGYYSYQGDTQRAKAGRSRLRHTVCGSVADGDEVADLAQHARSFLRRRILCGNSESSVLCGSSSRCVAGSMVLPTPVDTVGILFTTLWSSAACTQSGTSQTFSQRHLQQRKSSGSAQPSEGTHLGRILESRTSRSDGLHAMERHGLHRPLVSCWLSQKSSL
jgi:hypothetical protein